MGEAHPKFRRAALDDRYIWDSTYPLSCLSSASADLKNSVAPSWSKRTLSFRAAQLNLKITRVRSHVAIKGKVTEAFPNPILHVLLV